MNLFEWVNRGRQEQYYLLLVVKDLEDNSLFPVYFFTDEEADDYKNKIISESKLKVMQSYYL
jgi:hypothetical protein